MIALFGIGLWLSIVIIGIGALVYVIVKRMKDRDRENFEKRNF